MNLPRSDDTFVAEQEDMPISCDSVAPKHHDRKIDLPIRQRLLQVHPLEFLPILSTSVIIQSQPFQEVRPLGFREEVRLLWRIPHDERKCEAQYDRHKPFDDEDPAPAVEAPDAFHLVESEGEEAGKCAGDTGGGVEECETDLDLVAAVPCRTAED